MNTENLRKYFNIIKEKTNGNNSSNSEIIDYDNGNFISIDMIEEEYYKYLELADEIDNYIEENYLDDVLDKDAIKKHFADKIDQNLFMFNQAVLLDFTDFMAEKIKKENEKIRNVNISFGKNGNGYMTTKITLPVPWVKELGFTEEDKQARIELKDNKIIIYKEEK